MTAFLAIVCLLFSVRHAPDAEEQNETSGDRPIAVSILIDNSPRLEPSRAVIRGQLADFIRSLRPDDVAEVIEFSNDINVRQRFTSDVAALTRALAKSSSPSGRAVYGAIARALSDLDSFKTQGLCADCRRMLIVIAGGPDISSPIEPNQLLARVRRTRDVRIYSIAVPVEGHALDREIVSLFRQMAQVTGGRAFFPNRLEELPDVYSQLRY